MRSKYKRIVLKISGESLLDHDSHDIFDIHKVEHIAKVIETLHKNKIEVGVVVGAGNIFRGKLSDKLDLDHSDADYMGMLGTVINCLAISSKLDKMGVKNHVLSAIPLVKVCETYNYKNARKYLSDGDVVFYAGGTGKPFCTTYSCAALRALETHSDAILIGKNGVDGVYDSDPKINKNAKFIKILTLDDVLKLNLNVIDQGAVSILKGSNVVVKIFSANDTDNYLRVVNGEDIGTLIKE